MSMPDDQQERIPQVGVVGFKDDGTADDSLRSVFEELDTCIGDVDPTLFKDLDFSNATYEDLMNLPELADQPGPGSDAQVGAPGPSISAGETWARTESSDCTEKYQYIVSGLNDFESPTRSPSQLAPANGTKWHVPSTYRNSDLIPLEQGSPVDRGNLNGKEQLHYVTKPSERREILYDEQSLASHVSYANFRNDQHYIQEPEPGLSSQPVPGSQYMYDEAAYPIVRPNYPNFHIGTSPRIHEGSYLPPHTKYHPRFRPTEELVGDSRQTSGDVVIQSYPPDIPTDSDYSDGEVTPVSAQVSKGSEREYLPTASENGPRNRPTCAKTKRQPEFKSLQLTKRNPLYVPNEAYVPLRRAPESWGGRFRYTKDGELEPSDLFTPEQITQYLFEHPLHQQSQSKRSSKLVIRIHRNPPDSAKRFPTIHGSHRCRFRTCPSQNNTINQGQFAVIFEELSADHLDHDPFLNAGWVHMYCLERFCNFPKICRYLNVQAEKRHFPNESSKNKGNNCMRLDKIRGLDTLVEKFIEICRQGTLPNGYPRFNNRDEEGEPYEGTLCHRMCLKKQKGQPGTVNRQEAAREQAAGHKGATLSIHLGNLVVEGPIRQNTRRHKNQNQLVANPRQRRIYKRGAIRDESEEEDESNDDRGRLGNDEDDEDGGERPQGYQQRYPQYVAPMANMLLAAAQYPPQSLPPSASRYQFNTAYTLEFTKGTKRKSDYADGSDISDSVGRRTKKRKESHTSPSSVTRRIKNQKARHSSRSSATTSATNPTAEGAAYLQSPRALLENRRANRKRTHYIIDSDVDEDTIATQPKRQRTPQLTEDPSGSPTPRSAAIVPSTANLNRNAITHQQIRQAQILEQKRQHTRQRDRSERISNTSRAVSIMSSPASPTSHKQQYFEDVRSVAGRKRKGDDSVSPIELNDGPSKRPRGGRLVYERQGCASRASRGCCGDPAAQGYITQQSYNR